MYNFLEILVHTKFGYFSENLIIEVCICNKKFGGKVHKIIHYEMPDILRY